VGTFFTWLTRAGRITEQPPFWGGVATALAVKGGVRGRQAALRGSVSYLVAAFVANIVCKPFVRRRRPQGADKSRIGPLTSSFPSGHTASDLAFVFGAAQELPLLVIPLAGATVAGHWSLIQRRKHHMSDVFGGGTIGLGVAYIMWKSWPTGRSLAGVPGARLDRDLCRPTRPRPSTAVRPRAVSWFGSAAG
jgi:undecaprenyl-diphosphatase